ncbi:uncharacterized protein M421DRAFT_160751 [Didymella exigua CBS 183.55]|uniref:Uncharacterized protein n=1 Tax=Didymella exigua CBS 183.55 TaxID=1150837 RepID=A0A6A5RQ50_9PLEO|nr:uncharacterized protein M421DRAFT_160751 [Didymella exigua CBS 183.55]KAF1928436.1 hypothetical protein M421DRAFT_160751 [Didymella exigua CBS 183.55]
MDHWGDPWADNADDKSPTKNAVTSPLPPAFNFAPVPINDFVDDAGWGNNDDDGFGDWAASDTRNGAADIGSSETRAADEAPGSAGWDAVTYGQSEDWPEIVSPMPRVLDKVDSETSDSSTVAQLEEAASQIADEDEIEDEHEFEDEHETGDSTPTPQAEAEASVRSSTSPSETSRNELAVDSPRTSVEDERAVQNDDLPQEASLVGTKSSDAPTDTGLDALSVKEDTFPNDIEAIDGAEPAASITDSPRRASLESSVRSGETEGDDRRDSTIASATDQETLQSHAPSIGLSCNKALLDQLFPLSTEAIKQLEEHDDPIFATSARKAWYRLTRKQTMREYNHGENDDNYVRVTWGNSNVRTEVNKVVSRWAREDRISGTGPGARASFYWDTTAPVEAKPPFGHMRTRSSVPATKTALPARQSLPPLATSQSAAFNWSSPVSVDPWKIESPVQRSTSSPLALKNPTVAKLQRQEGRAVSVDLAPRRSDQTTPKQTATVSHPSPETKAVANLIPHPTTQLSDEVSETWANLDTSDNPSTSTIDVADTHVDDDDDWGEMVQTPTLPTPQQLDPFSQPSPASDTLPSPALRKPSPPVVTPVQSESIEAMFASPIVRLQSTISPTSALFKANTFIPLHAEQGPIGPGLLKPANRASRSTPEKKTEINISTASNAKSDPAAVQTASADENEILSFLDASGSMPSPPGFEDVTVAPSKAANLTPIAQPTAPVQASTDSWADADFSFFESALPTTAPQQPSYPQGPSDPFSFFDAPAPTSQRPSSQSVSRSPPRDTTPPPLQPLTNATGSLQRRKAEEDQVINDILSGLPDLSYMLR